MGLFLTKKIQETGLLEIKCPRNTRNISTESIITDKTFYIALNKDKKTIFKEGTSLWLLHPSSSCNWTGWVKMVSLCCLRIQRNDHCES